jgi:hypothetical protein
MDGRRHEEKRRRARMSMGPWAYYAPLWLGALLVAIVNDSIRAGLSHSSPAVQWTAVVALAVLAGLQSQVLMVGAQGAFAQVLPVPRGKSIRGRPAAVAGWLLIGWVALSLVTALLSYEAYFRDAALSRAAMIVGVGALAALSGSILIYIWSVPAAVADFGVDRSLGE